MGARLVTPRDVREARLPTRLLGYGQAETDVLLDSCALSLTALWLTIQQLADENSRLRKSLEERKPQ